VSGFDHSEVDAVVRAFASLNEIERLTEDNWVALKLT
jgi:hypothetical protein